MDVEALDRRIRQVDEQLFAVGLRALKGVGEAGRTENPALIKTAKLQMNSVLEHARGIYMARLFVALHEDQDGSVPEDKENEAGTYKMLDLIESGIQVIQDGMDLDDE